MSNISNNTTNCKIKPAQRAQLWTIKHPAIKTIGDRLQLIGYASGMRAGIVPKTT